jgi:hypothetical protein
MGDRAFCLLRDRAAVVTGWTDARIPRDVGGTSAATQMAAAVKPTSVRYSRAR